MLEKGDEKSWKESPGVRRQENELKGNSKRRRRKDARKGKKGGRS
jgi:hypothetical protein